MRKNIIQSCFEVRIIFHLFLFDGQNRICIVSVTDYDLIMKNRRLVYKKESAEMIIV